MNCANDCRARTAAHRSDFWAALDARIDLVTTLKAVETPEHLDGFWASFDAALRAEPERQLETADVVTLRTTVFDDALPTYRRTRRGHRRPWSRRRLEHLVQLSAAAASWPCCRSPGVVGHTRQSDKITALL